MKSKKKKSNKKKKRRSPVTVGVIGLGRSGWNIHINRIRDDNRFRVLAVTDPMPERRRQAVEELGCDEYPDHKALLAGCDAELIVNATPSHLHVPVTLDIFKAHRHCVLEKPVSKTVADFRRMARAAVTAKKNFFVHHNYRFLPEVRFLRELVESGRIGRLFEVKVRNLSFSRRYDWQTLRKYGGGILANHGTHFIDAVMYVMGMEDKIRDVWSDMKLVVDVGDAEDHCKVLLKTKSGTAADIEMSTACAFPEPKWTLLASHGTAVCDGKEAKIKYYSPSRLPKLKVAEKPLEKRNYDNRQLPWKEKTVPAVGKAKGDFYDNVAGVLLKNDPLFVMPDSIVEVLKVMEKAGSSKIINVRDS